MIVDPRRSLQQSHKRGDRARNQIIPLFRPATRRWGAPSGAAVSSVALEAAAGEQQVVITLDVWVAWPHQRNGVPASQRQADDNISHRKCFAGDVDAGAT